MAHPEGSPHRLAGHREDLRRRLVEGVLDPLILLRPAVLGQLAPTLEIGVVELVLRRLVGHGDRFDLGAQHGEPGADLVVGERLDLRLEVARSSTSGSIRLISRSFESTKRFRKPSMGGQYRRGASGDPSAEVPEARAVADQQHDEREGGQADPEQDRHQRRRRVHLRVGELRQAAPAQGGAPARRWSCSRQSPSGRRDRLEPAVGRVGGAGGSSVAWLAAAKRAASASTGAPARRRRSRRRSSRMSSVRATPSSQMSICWVSATSLENRAPTDSPRWIRLIASPMSGAIDKVLIFAIRFAAGSGIESVRTTSLSVEARILSTAGSDRTPWVAQA